MTSTSDGMVAVRTVTGRLNAAISPSPQTMLRMPVTKGMTTPWGVLKAPNSSAKSTASDNGTNVITSCRMNSPTVASMSGPPN
jgi:hypothetical protein